MKSKVDMARNNETRLKNVYKRKIEYRSKILFYLLFFEKESISLAARKEPSLIIFIIIYEN